MSENYFVGLASRQVDVRRSKVPVPTHFLVSGTAVGGENTILVQIQPDRGTIVPLIHLELVVSGLGSVEVRYEGVHVVVVLVNADASSLEVQIPIEMKSVAGGVVRFALSNGHSGGSQGQQGLDVVEVAIVGIGQTVDATRITECVEAVDLEVVGKMIAE